MSTAGATLHGWPSPSSPFTRAWRALSRRPWLLALGVSTLVVLVARLGPDWPAQEFRAQLARDVGLTAWNDQWYGGHPLAGYSLLYPPVAAVFGAAFTGLLAAVGCTWLVSRLLPPVDTGRRWFGVAAAVCVAGNLFLGQVPFLLGLFFGLAAFLAVLRSVPSWRASTVVALLAGAASLASPLAGLFLLLAGFTWAFDVGWRRALPLVAAVAGSVVALVVGGSGGPFPFPWDGLLDLLVFVTATLVLVPRRYTLIRRFVLIYAPVAVLSFVVPNPVGNNVIRLAQLLAVPAAFWMLARARKPLAVLAIGLLPAVFWQFYPIGSAAAHSAGDSSVNPSYYTGLLGFLSTQDPANGRLEIPFTREHWETARVAPYFPIARGWERQTDYQYDEVLYNPLTPASYRQWLTSAGVDLVALPDAPIDYGGRAEQALLAHPPAYLVPVWHDAHWQVWHVTGAQPLVSGASLTKLGTSSFKLDFTAPGDAVVRVRMSSLWQVTAGEGCVLPSEPDGDGWVHVRATEPGDLTVRARFTLSSVLSSSQAPC
jgi:hypothetical protein